MADAVAVEPISTATFPINREINREFCDFRRAPRLRWLTSPKISETWSQIPYSMKQGISPAEQGILAQEQGILPANRKSPPDAIFGTHTGYIRHQFRTSCEYISVALSIRDTRQYSSVWWASANSPGPMITVGGDPNAGVRAEASVK